MRFRLWATVFLVAGFAGCLVWSCSQPASNETSTLASDTLSAQSTYIDPMACKPCHESIVNQYLTTGKGRSFYKASPRFAFENWKVAPVYDSSSKLFYQPFQADTSFFVKEFRMIGKDTAHTRTERIDFFIGSGNQTRSYLFQRNGYLFEHPITWYSRKKMWDLSPGYAHGANERFDRSIGTQCLFCHNSGYESVPNSLNRYTGFGHALSCGVCHGDAAGHMQSAKNGQASGGLVSLKKIPVQARMDVCRQCHLEGIKVRKKNAKPGEYQPGSLLSDYYEVFIPTEGMTTDFGFASHAERLQQSVCFRQSAGRLECISCHDPHAALPANPVEFYNQKCRSCHADGHQKVCSSVKSTAADCKRCHMQVSGTSDIPHVQSTDHLIRRKRSIQQKETDKELVFRNFAGSNVAEADVASARLAYAESQSKQPGFKEVELYLQHLSADAQLKYYYLSSKPWLGALDTTSFSASPNAWNQFYWSQLKLKAGIAGGLGNLKKACELAPYMIEFQYRLAVALDQCLQPAENQYKKVLGLDPKHVKSLGNLGFYALERKDYKTARQLLSLAIQQNPDYTLALENLARCSMEEGRYTDAKKLLKRLIEQNPGEQRYPSILQTLP